MLKIRFLCVAALLVAGCSSAQHAGPRATPTPLRNPLDVPLYPGAAVVATHSFHQIVATQQNAGPVFRGGAGTYTGEEVVAVSDASFARLSAWVERADAHPPAGYVRLGESSEVHAQVRTYGFDYATFERPGKRLHGVLVIVMDPRRVEQRFGGVLGMIAHYRMLPSFLRAPIDAQVKAQVGITLSDAMEPESPIGATLAALDELGHRNARGIIVIDAMRR